MKALFLVALSFLGQKPEYRLAIFQAEVTVPLGHALMGGGIQPAKKVADPLYALGWVLQGAGKPIVFVAVDWCEIRNDAYERWRAVLAEAAGTTPERVMVCALHQHDAPVVDLEGQRLLEKVKARGSICDRDFHEKAVQRVAASLKASMNKSRRVTHFGAGQARVDKIASNRRYLVDGKPQFGRTSATRDPKIREMPEGTIDPYLKSFSFWDEGRAVLVLSCYAVHPMSYYGRGEVSADFVGQARKRRQADDPAVFQIYTSGCSGNVTAGKYNDGSTENRAVLADRLYQAMREAFQQTRTFPLERVEYRVAALKLQARSDAGFGEKELGKRLESDARPFGQCLAALGLSWRKRVEAGKAIDVPALDLGSAVLLLLPAEAYVEYQLLAQKERPRDFVVTIGYGECGPGYIPTEQAVREKDSNLRDWCWVAPGAEKSMTAAIRQALKVR